MLTMNQKASGKPRPWLLGDQLKIDITLPEADVQDEESSLGTLPAIKIYDDDVTMRFLVCGLPSTLVCLVYHFYFVFKFVTLLNKLVVPLTVYVSSSGCLLVGIFGGWT